MNSFLLRMWPLLLILAAINASAGENAGLRIYSDVRYIEEGAGDLVGTELELKIERNEATGVLRIYEGGCAGPVPVTGFLSGNKVHVSGQSEVYGKVEITGTVLRNSFDGLMRLEKAQAPEKIRLKRITKPHC